MPCVKVGPWRHEKLISDQQLVAIRVKCPRNMKAPGAHTVITILDIRNVSNKNRTSQRKKEKIRKQSGGESETLSATAPRYSYGFLYKND